jgi:hypothetical protein
MSLGGAAPPAGISGSAVGGAFCAAGGGSTAGASGADSPDVSGARGALYSSRYTFGPAASGDVGARRGSPP